MDAEIKRFSTQWFVVPSDGQRGGIAVASHQAAKVLCNARGWRVVTVSDQLDWSQPYDEPDNA